MTESIGLKAEYLIADEAGLREIYPQAQGLAVKKCISRLDRHARDFIERSPFLCIGTQAPDGRADVSPRGDPAGFVKILDDRTLLIPDRPGNNRLDTLSNIVANPSVGLLFLVPGFDDTLRINGTAFITRDPELLALLEVQGRKPATAIAVQVREIFLHCAKAFRRSNLWDPAARRDRSEMPSLAKMILDQSTGAPQDEKEMQRIDADLEEAYRTTMY